MKRHPEGAITRRDQLEKLIRQAKKTNEPVKFWIVRSFGPQERLILAYTKLGKRGLHLFDYGYWDKTEFGGRKVRTRTYDFSKDTGYNEIHLFSNWWLAWAYSSRIAKPHV